MTSYKDRYWQYEPEAPFATLLSVVAGCCHPEAWEGTDERFRARLWRDLCPGEPMPGQG